MTPATSRAVFKFASLAMLLAVVVTFQNCGQFVVSNAVGNLSFSSTGGGELQPASDKVDAACQSKSVYDACLFKKNPVAQGGVALSGSPLSLNLDNLQTYGVKLTSLASNDRLQNPWLKIVTATGTEVATRTKAVFKTRSQNDSNRYFSQVMAYYWMTRASEYIELRTGVYPLRDHPVSVVVDDSIGGWAARTNSIHLRSGDGNPMAWSAELSIYFLGLANLHHASGGAIEQLDTSKHVTCGLKAYGCCATAAGCARAIGSGVGDYMAAMVFPDKPVIGETVANAPAGMGQCGLARDLSQTAARSASAAYSACASTQGEVSTLGGIYASIWWEVRKGAKAQGGASGELAIDKLFMRHLSELTGGDTFASAIAKAKTLDARLNAGKFSPLFTAQLSARGL